ncbi:hypothetical protein BLA13014_04099 [Burkholderia aenigmatica]|uniref:Acb2/Tad1 hairpin domain-containing protein n=1 Tax=Burkholderia aenigmatica TaxID=2015348 RepID=A0A6P2N2W5_9BURK|nr:MULTISPECIES: hypothetical protein [Burkholderia]VWB88550.1 hypothetical protein BLA13014_04099 [Burkholderia aenigmatica]
MDNQHQRIKGYRDLSQAEIDLMNEIKAKGEELLHLQARLAGFLDTQRETLTCAAKVSTTHEPWQQGASGECIELRRFLAAEPQRWAAIGKTDIQTGIMALVRAVAQPAI